MQAPKVRHLDIRQDDLDKAQMAMGDAAGRIAGSHRVAVLLRHRRCSSLD
jgi:hypothetical protein